MSNVIDQLALDRLREDFDNYEDSDGCPDYNHAPVKGKTTK